MKRCKHCGNVLGWPGVEFSRKERLIFFTIFNATLPIKNAIELGRLCKLSPNAVRVLVGRIKKKLPANKVLILTKPYRVIRYREVKPTGAYRDIICDDQSSE